MLPHLFNLRRRASLATAALLALAAGCSSSGDNANGNGNGSGTGATGGFGVDTTQTLLVKNGQTNANIYNNGKVLVVASDVAIAGTTSIPLLLSNSGSTGALRISKATFSYTPGSPAEGDQPAFTCSGKTNGQDVACDAMAFPDLAPAGIVSLQVHFLRYDDAVNRKATLCFATNDVTPAKQKYCVEFTTSSGAAKIKVNPEIIDFGPVQVGSNTPVPLQILNLGNADLVVSSVDLANLEGDLFKFVLSGQEYPAGGKVDFSPPLTIKPGDIVNASMLFNAKDDKPRSTEIFFQTNDPSLAQPGPGIKRVAVKVNSTGPCLLLSPKAVVFGPTPVGQTKKQVLQLKSCGDEPVVITNVALDSSPAAGNFAPDWATFAAGNNQAPSQANPLTIPVNGVLQLNVLYTPASLATVQPDGSVASDLANLVFTSNIAAVTSKASLEGYGAASDCPVPIITIMEGDTVTPQTVLHIDGKQSYASVQTASITEYQWSVEQPMGSVGLLLPNDKAAAVSFQPNVAGNYKFRLQIKDSTGKSSCAPAEKIVKVIPDQAIHVELLWKTPGDKDESDSGPGAGSDLDLHFAHQYAAGQDYDKDGKPDPWFAGQYDCFWLNCGNGNSVQWGSYDPNIDDDPHLDRDDTDGAGPENLNLTLPEDGRTYSVGVHYYNDFGLGPSVATVRVYIYGVLQYEVTSTNLVKSDMWYVALVGWPDASIDAASGGGSGLFITHKYPAPSLE